MSDIVLSVDDVRLQRGARAVLNGVTFDVRRGELVAVMGPSGCGKTTVLRAVVGLEAFDAGRISVDGVALTPGRLPGVDAMKVLCRKVGMVFQFHCLFEHLSVMDNVCLAPVHALGVSREAAEARAHALLTSFGVDHRASALPRQLSGGEAQRVAIARALAVDPPVLLMDEPTASLDPERRNELGALLTDLCRQGRSLVVVTHDDDFAHDFSTRVLRLRNGVVQAPVPA